MVPPIQQVLKSISGSENCLTRTPCTWCRPSGFPPGCISLYSPTPALICHQPVFVLSGAPCFREPMDTPAVSSQATAEVFKNNIQLSKF